MIDKEKFVTEVILYLNRSRYEIIKKKHGAVPQIILGEFLESIYDDETIPQIAASFKVSIQTINRILRANFPTIKLLGLRTWKYHFLDCIGTRFCNSCKEIKTKEEFSNTKMGVTGKRSICKKCDQIKKKTTSTR